MSTDLFGAPDLAMAQADVAQLTATARAARLEALTIEAHKILDDAIETHVTTANRSNAGVVGLFSGGNDSTVLMHLMRDRLTHAAHANTTIGVEATRQFVRDTCADWGLPLLEVTPPRESDQYRALVLDQGFPGPGHHYKMYQRLKERGLEEVRRRLVLNPRKERVVFVAGRRRSESARRAQIVQHERRRSVVWASPLVNWTKLDLNTYRQQNDVPLNEVTQKIHKSGECLCGAFAAPGEFAELSYWFPEVAAEIEALEAEIHDRDDIPEHRRCWGWGADPTLLNVDRRPSESGMLCSSCEWQQATLLDGWADGASAGVTTTEDRMPTADDHTTHRKDQP